MALIKDIAQICKSKNAGPFYITIDVLFEDHTLYRQVKETGVLSPALFATLYGVEEKDVLFTPYDTAAAFKATLPRAIPAGDLGDTDVYGAQQHAPLLDVDIPLPG
ncbi:DUF4387 domain-containing protein [Vreelandella malpeensis]|uniref:DUF4387 domain-containing protein n=1 Tax=Vreelandella malpeensis TaxID=1172368 RepID=A0ABS8DXB9_9GAMM|nr:DUF4387 domain-containing protein [Halomonas malpeensis]MCB8890655.1 DUF4387 domain-containing protein [Halomonas malpeensis]